MNVLCALVRLVVWSTIRRTLRIKPVCRKVWSERPVVSVPRLTMAVRKRNAAREYDKDSVRAEKRIR